jgi:hypothetical protein
LSKDRLRIFFIFTPSIGDFRSGNLISPHVHYSRIKIRLSANWLLLHKT